MILLEDSIGALEDMIGNWRVLLEHIIGGWRILQEDIIGGY